jgi:hypothetical protein
MIKEEKALKQIEDQIKKDCTFTPALTNKPQKEFKGKTSVIDLVPKPKTVKPPIPTNASPPTAKYD